MYIVLIAWFYVALMMALAEAMSPMGTWLGAIMTFVLYGLLPMGIVGYIMGSPARRRARQTAEQAANSALPPDARSHSSSDTVASIREKS